MAEKTYQQKKKRVRWIHRISTILFAMVLGTFYFFPEFLAEEQSRIKTVVIIAFIVVTLSGMILELYFASKDGHEEAK